MSLRLEMCFAIVGIAALAAPALALAPSRDEMAEAAKWVAAKFEGKAAEGSREQGLVVIANHGPVQLNARGGQPLQLGPDHYVRGLFCHAPSHVIVRLPGPGESFSCFAGVDTAAGGGSVVFSVDVNGTEAFKSDIVRGGDRALPIYVDLHGADELVLRVGDAGDGISCDQADWAQAQVTLKDGSQVYLGDLPIIEYKPGGPSVAPPFSFAYDGMPSSELLPTWKLERASKKLDANRTQRSLTYTDPNAGLVVRCIGVEYSDFPTIEWTVYFRNTGTADTPILSDIQALDTRIERGGQSEFVLNHHKGTFIRPDDFEPLRSVLGPDQKMRFAPPGGRPLGAVFPYFNLEYDGGGVIAVVGWPGQWAAEFARDSANTLTLKAGQELTHLRLHPGEEVRTPLMALQFYKGDRVRAQNTWRRWMIAHNLPRQNGELPKPGLPAVSGNHFPGLLCNEADEIMFIDKFLAEGIKLDYWWMDAGWYVNKGDWTSTGTWEVDTKRFPRGLKSISDHCHAKGMQLIVWFEPERVTADSWLTNNHPEWVLGGALLNIGDPEARKWVTERIDKIITEQGIDYYRQDYNIDPLSYWRANDSEDRQGITENHYVTGYLAFWDELRRRHPDMLIDSCASGGHRNDLETMRRSLPLLRSDYITDPVGEQCHSYGLWQWLPYTGTGFINCDDYVFRSTMGPSTTLGQDVRRKDIDWNQLRRMVKLWREIVPNYYGDFYPLTDYSLTNAQWMAWQFDRPETGEGMVQVFRRSESVYESARFRLHGLAPDAKYTVKDQDARAGKTISGKELMEKGLLVEISEKPGAVVVTYKQAK